MNRNDYKINVNLEFKKRIDYTEDLKSILSNVCKAYSLGEFFSYRIIPIGYEDCNVFLQTSTGKYFVKIFGAFRTTPACQKYLEVMLKVLKAGVSHPKLYQSSRGYLYQTTAKNVQIRLCVMEFLEGSTFFDLKQEPSLQEQRSLIKQAVRINQINYEPEPTYDPWTINNFLKEYRRKKQYLSKADKRLIAPLAKQFAVLDLKSLPHCFVHGDILKTNVFKNNKGKLYILDFSVSSYSPRIQELAVMLSGLFYDKDKPESFRRIYQRTVREYQKNIRLTEREIKFLPLYTKVAHAMNLLLCNYEAVVKRNRSEENKYWLSLARSGLR